MNQPLQKTAPENVTHTQMANAIRALSMDAVQKANSGHPGMPMGVADIATVLFSEFLKFDPSKPEWPDRDRFILSAGHGSMLQYALHYLVGYPDMTLDELKNFRQWGARTAGHPEHGHAAGIETTTGPLGQGIANAVGMALAERALNAEFGDDLTSHFTYAIVGDGCLMEGISHEAMSLAGHLKLNKLIVLWDDNRICIDGPTDMTVSDDQLKRAEANGWRAEAIDGHDMSQIREALKRAQKSDKPSFIACRTTIAHGAPTKAGKNSSHGSPLGAEEITGARANLHWPHAPFEIPADILASWRAVGKAGNAEYNAWEKRLAASANAAAFTARMSGDFGDRWNNSILKLKQALAEGQPKEATRVSSQNVLEAIVPALPALLGGSADLTGSNNTKTKAMVPFSPDTRHPTPVTPYLGRYIYYGVREHAMAAAMNGIALHGGFVPYGGTFLVFTDYCRPAIRLSALMEQRVIYVMTHDSIGLGEDGPTHQPVEHLASLRAIPNLNVFRPADATETAECWQLAIASPHTPSILALSRQGLPHLRAEFTADNKCARGGYILREASGAPKVVIMATGSETHLAVEAAKKLEEKGTPTRVVSVPCLDLLLAQTPHYRRELLPDSAKRIVVEAGIEQGWDKLLGEMGTFIGMKSFGASAPAEVLYEKFGITVDAIVKAAS